MAHVEYSELTFQADERQAPITVSGQKAVAAALHQLGNFYRASTNAGIDAAQYWADISVNSKSPFAPLADIPGAFAALWIPETAPKTALTLSIAAYTFAAVPRSLVHFTTEEGAAGIAASRAIYASRGFRAVFGPGVYMARIGRPINLFVQAVSRVPIVIATPAGTARIIPYLVYVRWGTDAVKLK